jgi:hypothetical protein
MIFFPSFSTIILLIYTVRIFQSLFIDEINDVLVCMCEFSSCDSFIWFLFHLITYSCNKIFINSIVFISKSILLLVCVYIYTQHPLLKSIKKEACLEVWLRLFFKVIFTQKYIKIILFIF